MLLFDTNVGLMNDVIYFNNNNKIIILYNIYFYLKVIIERGQQG